MNAAAGLNREQRSRRTRPHVESAQRNGSRPALVFGLIIQPHGPRGGYRPGSQCVDAYSAWAELRGQRLRQRGEGAFYGTVERGVG